MQTQWTENSCARFLICVHEAARKLRGWTPAGTYCLTDFTKSCKSVEQIGAAFAAADIYACAIGPGRTELTEMDHV